MTEMASTLKTLAVDIGGSGVKVLLLDENGKAIRDRTRVDTPQPATPTAIIAAILEMAATQGEFDRVSVGFPGVVRHGITETAVNLDKSWLGFPLTQTLIAKLGKPVRSVNDADMQGLGSIKGQGVELVVTLGTGFGSGLFLEGCLVPNLELGHHPFRKGQTYEEQLGRAALDSIGKDKWNKRLREAIATLDHLFNYDTLYLGGGNTKKITFGLPARTEIVPNISGLLGGIALWNR